MPCGNITKEESKIENTETALRVGSKQSPTRLDGIRGAIEGLNIAGVSQQMVVKQRIGVGRWCEAGRRMPDSNIQHVGSKKVEKTEAVETGVDGTILKQSTTQEAQQFEYQACGGRNRRPRMKAFGQDKQHRADGECSTRSRRVLDGRTQEDGGRGLDNTKEDAVATTTTPDTPPTHPCHHPTPPHPPLAHHHPHTTTTPTHTHTHPLHQ